MGLVAIPAYYEHTLTKFGFADDAFVVHMDGVAIHIYKYFSLMIYRLDLG